MLVAGLLFYGVSVSPKRYNNINWVQFTDCRSNAVIVCPKIAFLLILKVITYSVSSTCFPNYYSSFSIILSFVTCRANFYTKFLMFN